MMKTKIFKSVMTSFVLLTTVTLSFSQINYSASSGYYYPNTGTSNQLSATIDYDDTTGVINSFEFDVFLFSFLNTQGSFNMIAWLGGADYFPSMEFKSRSIDQEGEDLTIKGSLYFRGRYMPVTIYAEREEDKNQFTINGKFRIATSDFIKFVSPRRGIPTYLNMDFSVTFDKNASLKS
ncbi:MAG: YceI family protein [Saprospiraceae bacterium]|nr:YceI family protein [Saprospiraceae bacterium]